VNLIFSFYKLSFLQTIFFFHTQIIILNFTL
jgi:hypothetical protein